MAMISNKIKNQIAKVESFFYNKKLKNFKSKLKSCGDNVFIQLPVRFEGMNAISIGNNVSINAFVHIWGNGGVEIGDDTLIASNVNITSLTHDKLARLYRESVIERKVVIGKNVWIGTNAVILPGITIGDNSIIGAGSVVTKDVLPNQIVAGVPAKPIKSND